MHISELFPCQISEWFISGSAEVRGCIQKFTDWVDNEMYAYLWYCSL